MCIEKVKKKSSSNIKYKQRDSLIKRIYFKHKFPKFIFDTSNYVIIKYNQVISSLIKRIYFKQKFPKFKRKTISNFL